MEAEPQTGKEAAPSPFKFLLLRGSESTRAIETAGPKLKGEEVGE